MHWGKFNDLAENLRRIAPLSTPTFEAFAYECADELDKSQRFFFPSAAVIEGTPMSPTPPKLPYPQIALLSYDEEEKAWMIILASETESGGVATRVFVCGPKFNHKWAMTGVVGMWNPTRGIGVKPDTIYERLKELHPFAEPLEEHRKTVLFVMSLIDTFCEALTMPQTAIERVDAPEKLNKARARRGKSALPDYHILRIGGERWASDRDVTQSARDGVRSHLRRGHIRRLGSREVWVRSTYVHGRKPGFVHKDYEVS